MNFDDGAIAVIGLGYVGLPLAVEFARHRPVLGFDINPQRIAQLRQGEDSTLEVDAGSLAEATHIRYSADAQDLRGCRIFIVTVPTPVDKANRPDLEPLRSASTLVGNAMGPGSLVIYESTVYPGATEEVCVPLLESNSGLRFNHDFFCGYSPERINPADKVNTLTRIRKITSGSTPEAAEAVDALYAAIISAGTHRASSIRVAEAAKVIENTQRDLNIALMNELSVVFARLNIDTMEVLEAAASKWNFMPFRPGLVGGHCIGVDPYYLTHKAEEVGYLPQVILAGRRINDNMGRYVARNAVKLMLQAGLDVARARVGVMGITFKENCPDVRNSKVVDLVHELADWGVSVEVTDPLADPHEVRSAYGITLSELGEGRYDALVVAVGHKDYRALDVARLRSYCRGDQPVLVDVKSLYDRHAAAATGFTIFRL